MSNESRAPFWLPEGATRAKKGQASPNLVNYITPAGKVRSYVAGKEEAAFYALVFSEGRNFGTEPA